MRLSATELIFLIIFFLSETVLTAQGERARAHSQTNPLDTLGNEQVLNKPVKGKPVSTPRGTEGIILDEQASLKYLQKIYSASGIWKRSTDPLREAIGILLYHATKPPIDTTTRFLSDYDFDKIRIPLENFYQIDSVRIIFPFVPADTSVKDTAAARPVNNEMFIEAGKNIEKVKLTTDSKPIVRNDTLRLNDSVYISVRELIPSVIPKQSTDTIILVVTDTLPEPTINRKDFPFRYLRYPYMTDSMQVAINSLIGFIETRDSTQLDIINESGRSSKVWLNSLGDNIIRFWLPDGNGDSITVWIGSPERNTLSLKAEEGILFKKQMWHDKYVDTKVNITTPAAEELRSVALRKVKPVYWKYRTDASYQFSQGLFSSWAKGGTNNVTSLLDVTEYLDYTNTAKKVTSNNTVRFALGFTVLGNNGDQNLRKNKDIIELNSKISHKAFGKFDFSGVVQFKTQLLPGYKYPNDTLRVKVSKFFNPATLIVGYGLEYKPDKKTSISFSPISYKGTYVSDTAMIDQTTYGIAANRKSMNEMGMYLTLSSKTKLFESVDMTNKIQLFSNFLSKPQNVDVDWEIIMAASLNWFTQVKLNMHFIYDDNTLIPLYDNNGDAITDADGDQVTGRRLQFNELMGLSLAFKF